MADGERGGRRRAAATRAVEQAREESGSQLAALRAVFRMPKRHREAIAAFLGVDVENAAVPAYIALCIEHNVSPFLGHFHLIEERVKQRNAEGKAEEVFRLRPAAGRDGFLAVARSSGTFAGLQGDVVCANDVYGGADWTAPGEAPYVLHQQARLVPGQDASAARNYRGAIIGAWAKARHSNGEPPTFYFAPLREHGRADGGEWAGAWSYTSAMILKCAQSWVLRIGWGISGVLPVDELRADPERVREEFGDAVPSVHHDLDDVAWPEGKLGERLRAAVERANELSPNLYTAATVQMLFGGQSEAQLERIAADIERTNEAQAKRPAKRKAGGKS